MKTAEKDERLEKLKKELGLNDTQLAEAGGCSRQYINAVIHGKKKLSNKIWKEIQNSLMD